MAKNNVVFSKDNEYYTPQELVDYFGKFDYDPATTEEKAREFGIKHFDTIETDGLKREWGVYKRIWINPPFTIKHDFLKKAVDTYKEHHNDIFILFPIEFITTKRFHKIMEGVGGILFIPNGRIKFESGLGKKSSSPAFGSIVMKISDRYGKDFIGFSINLYDIM